MVNYEHGHQIQSRILGPFYLIFILHMNEQLAEMLKVFLGASEEESKDDVKESE